MTIKFLRDNHPIIFQKMPERGRERINDNEECSLACAFDWCTSPQGSHVWSSVHNGEYDAFYDYYNMPNPRYLEHMEFLPGDTFTNTLNNITEVKVIQKTYVSVVTTKGTNYDIPKDMLRRKLDGGNYTDFKYAPKTSYVRNAYYRKKYGSGKVPGKRAEDLAILPVPIEDCPKAKGRMEADAKVPVEPIKSETEPTVKINTYYKYTVGIGKPGFLEITHIDEGRDKVSYMDWPSRLHVSESLDEVKGHIKNDAITEIEYVTTVRDPEVGTFLECTNGGLYIVRDVEFGKVTIEDVNRHSKFTITVSLYCILIVDGCFKVSKYSNDELETTNIGVFEPSRMNTELPNISYLFEDDGETVELHKPDGKGLLNTDAVSEFSKEKLIISKNNKLII